jgi:hypothetical protein
MLEIRDSLAGERFAMILNTPPFGAYVRWSVNKIPSVISAKSFDLFIHGGKPS